MFHQTLSFAVFSTVRMALGWLPPTDLRANWTLFEFHRSRGHVKGASSFPIFEILSFISFICILTDFAIFNCTVKIPVKLAILCGAFYTLNVTN